MSFIGKMIGGTIGFALGGPLGAVVGAVLGSGFDKKEKRHFAQNTTSFGQKESDNIIFFTAAFSMLAKIAKADGKITSEEINEIENFMSNDLNLDATSRAFAINIFKKAADSNEKFEDFAIQFYEQFKTKPEIIEIMLETFIKVSIADKDFDKNEEALILEAVRIFSYNQNNYESLKSKHIKDSNKFYNILQCSKKDSLTHIKKQYRKLANEYHPDKIISKGLPEEFIELANKKFQEIQNAYEKIKKEKE